ncbi:MAG: NAD-dependent epimerase/dehydratase family protein [Thermoguttaceae bacterium]
MQTLVTGGGGFLGRYIVEMLLQRGDEVRIFGRGAYPELEQLGAEIFKGDVRDKKSVSAACEGIECVFHTAALPGIQCRWEPFFAVNVFGTMNILAACLDNKVKKLVYTGSPSCVFNGKSQENIDETTPYPKKWSAHYPHSKAVAEKLVISANSEKLLTCSLRPHLIWGPRDNHLIPRLLDRAKRGKLIQIGNGTNLVDNVYVENAAKAHILAADALIPGGKVAGNAYFISQGQPINCWGWINEILALADLPPVRRRVSHTVAWGVGAAVETVYNLFGLSGEPNISRFLVGQLAHSHYFNISAARNDFGYSPEVSTEEGMKRLGEWIKEEKLDVRR